MRQAIKLSQLLLSLLLVAHLSNGQPLPCSRAPVSVMTLAIFPVRQHVLMGVTVPFESADVGGGFGVFSQSTDRGQSMLYPLFFGQISVPVSKWIGLGANVATALTPQTKLGAGLQLQLRATPRLTTSVHGHSLLGFGVGIAYKVF